MLLRLSLIAIKLRTWHWGSSKMIRWYVFHVLPRCMIPHVNGKILTHSYSRVVMKTLLRAHERKRISVYVTEARPRGLGFAFILCNFSISKED